MFVLFVLQKYAINIGAVISLIISAMWLVLGYLMIAFANTLIPIVQLILLTWLSLVSVFLHSKYKQDLHLRELINNINQRMFGRYLPKSIIEQSSPWESVLSLVNQQLSLNRGMFLARVESDHRLYEIQAINCQLNDIEELRRDYERPPYSDAIKELGAIKIARPFFKGLNSDELQYIAPLMYAGDIRGFWVMTIKGHENFNEAAFIHNVNRFASQIGELLYHYRISMQIQQSQSQTLTRVLTLNLLESPSKKVQSAIAGMEQKLSTLEHLFNHLNSAVIVFNLFGQVVEVNESFETLAAKQNLKTFGMSAFDLLMHCCQFDADTTKGKLRYLTLHKGQFTRLVEFGTHQYILTVVSMDKIAANSQFGSPFSISGILFEFIDISSLLQIQGDPNILEKLHRPSISSDNDSWGDI